MINLGVFDKLETDGKPLTTLPSRSWIVRFRIFKEEAGIIFQQIYNLFQENKICFFSFVIRKHNAVQVDFFLYTELKGVAVRKPKFLQILELCQISSSRYLIVSCSPRTNSFISAAEMVELLDIIGKKKDDKFLTYAFSIGKSIYNIAPPNLINFVNLLGLQMSEEGELSLVQREKLPIGLNNLFSNSIQNATLLLPGSSNTLQETSQGNNNQDALLEFEKKTVLSLARKYEFSKEFLELKKKY